MKTNSQHFSLLLAALVCCACIHVNNGGNSPVVSLNPEDFCPHSFLLSDFVDEVHFVTLDTSMVISCHVTGIQDGRIIVFGSKEDKWSFNVFDMNGKFLQQIGAEGNAPDEYCGPSECVYDATNDRYIVSARQSSDYFLKYYSSDGTFLYSSPVNYLKKHFHGDMGYMNSNLFLYSSPTEDAQPSDTTLAWVIQDAEGKVIQSARSWENKPFLSYDIDKCMGELFRDHWLLWSFNDTIWYVNDKSFHPAYRWDIREPLRRTRETFGMPYDYLYEPFRLIDAKDYLFILGMNKKFHCYSKSEGCLYGNAMPRNDVYYIDLGEYPLTGYYYDEETKSEYLWSDNFPSVYIEALEDEGTPEALKLAKQFDPDGNRVVVMARLKKNKK